MPKSVPAVTHGPKPVGPYSVVTEAAGLVFVSGQVGIDPGAGKGVPGGAVAETEQIMVNLGAILGDVGLGFEDVVKTTIFLADIADFAAVNEVYARFFPGRPPARTTVGVAALPVGFEVEIDVIAAR